MRYGTLINPELILDKRGIATARELYRNALRMVEILPSGVGIKADDEITHLLAASFRSDKVFSRFMTTAKLFSASNAPIYHIGRDFLQTLQKIDREIPVDILPERFLAFFQFAEKTVFDDDGEVEGGYICIDRGRNIGMRDALADERILSISYLCQPRINDMNAFASMTVPLTAKKLSDLSAGHPVEDFLWGENRTPEQIAKRDSVFRAVLNATIYLFSEDPILEKARPFRELGFSVKEMKRRGLIINDTTVPITFINRGYVRPRNYEVDSTWVESFPRWQRCGPALTKVKLVFVTAHERKFKKEESL